MRKVLIVSPVRQKTYIFEEFIKGLDSLEIPDDVIVDRFFVINDCPECIPLLKNCKYMICDTNDEYKVTDNTHIWSADNLSKMELLRNICLHFAEENGYDYVLSVDSDLVLHPSTLKVLLGSNKELVAEVFWTESDVGIEWPNAWMYDQCTLDPDSLKEWRKEGLYEVGGTGACFLISTDVIRKGVDYSNIPNIKYCLYGEDRSFCIRALCNGYKLYLDTHCPATHLYTDKVYKEWIENARKG